MGQPFFMIHKDGNTKSTNKNAKVVNKNEIVNYN
jgi:hypothetical protein